MKRASKAATATERAEQQLRAARAHLADIEERLADAGRTVEMAIDAARPHRLGASRGDPAALEKIAELERTRAGAEDAQRSLAIELDEARAAVRSAESQIESARAEDALAEAQAFADPPIPQVRMNTYRAPAGTFSRKKARHGSMKTRERRGLGAGRVAGEETRR